MVPRCTRWRFIDVDLGERLDERRERKQPSHDALVITKQSDAPSAQVSHTEGQFITYKKSIPAITPMATLSLVPLKPKYWEPNITDPLLVLYSLLEAAPVVVSMFVDGGCLRAMMGRAPERLYRVACHSQGVPNDLMVNGRRARNRTPKIFCPSSVTSTRERERAAV